MAMKPQLRSKEPRGIGHNRIARREFAECGSLLVGRVQLQNGFGPQLALGEPFVDESVDPRIKNMNKALDVVLVFPDDVITQAENIKGHVRSHQSNRLAELALTCRSPTGSQLNMIGYG